MISIAWWENSMNDERVREAGRYLLEFFAAKRDHYHRVMQETHPNAGYGRYDGAEEIAQIMRSIYHYTEEKFSSVEIPRIYASPQHLSDEIREYSSYVDFQNQKLEKALRKIRKQFPDMP